VGKKKKSAIKGLRETKGPAGQPSRVISLRPLNVLLGDPLKKRGRRETGRLQRRSWEEKCLHLVKLSSPKCDRKFANAE